MQLTLRKGSFTVDDLAQSAGIQGALPGTGSSVYLMKDA